MLQVVTASNIACCIRNGKWNLPKLISILARVRCRLVRLYGQRYGSENVVGGWENGLGCGKWKWKIGSLLRYIEPLAGAIDRPAIRWRNPFASD